MGIPAAIIIVALVAAGHLLGQLFALGCSENVEPGTVRGDVCDDVGGLWSFTWWLAVLWPAALFALSLLIPTLRKHPISVAALIGLLVAAFWTALLLAVSGNIGS